MKHILASIGLCAGLAVAATGALAENWQLVPEESKIAFGSIKKNTAGESHHFGSLTGEVDEAGEVTIGIDLSSVETWIDIRNERIIEHVFGGMATATVTGKVDATALSAVAPGATTVVGIKGTLNFLGSDVPVDTDMFVARLSDDRVLVSTDEMIMLGTDELGISAAVDKLREIAELPGITQVTPVTLRLIFQK